MTESSSKSRYLVSAHDRDSLAATESAPGTLVQLAQESTLPADAQKTFHNHAQLPGRSLYLAGRSESQSSASYFLGKNALSLAWKSYE